MCPVVRTPNQCCVNKAIQYLSFDPQLQDSAWQRARARAASSKPYSATDHRSCGKRTSRGELVCDVGVLDVLDTLGVKLDPTSSTVATDATPAARQRASPEPGRSGIPKLTHLTHNSLYIPGRQSKTPTSCADYLKQNPGANRVRMLSELAACLQYLHANKIIHAALRPDALFVDDEGFPLLAYSPDAPMRPPSRQSLDPYTAPELQGVPPGSKPNIQSDVYAFGSIIHWMCTGKHPYHEIVKPSVPASLRGEGTDRFSSAARAQLMQLSIPGSSSFSGAVQGHGAINQQAVLFELTDYTLKSLVYSCRAKNPASRPAMLNVVLQLQQILVRHVLPNLPLPPPETLSSPLAAYVPRHQHHPVASIEAIQQGTVNNMRSLILSPRPSAPIIREPMPRRPALPKVDPISRPVDPASARTAFVGMGGSQMNTGSSLTAGSSSTAGTARQAELAGYREPQRYETSYLNSGPNTPFNRATQLPSLSRDTGPKVVLYPPPPPSMAPPPQMMHSSKSPLAPSSSSWDDFFVPQLQPQMPSTASLQPPHSSWAPSEGATGIHRNKTL